MDGNISRPKLNEGAGLWMLKMAGGVIIVVILMIHFVVNHLVAPQGLLTYADVLRYYQNPIIPIMEIAFVFFAVLHSLLGLRSILLDLNPSTALLKVTDILFLGLGAVSVTYGIWLILVLTSRSAALP